MGIDRVRQGQTGGIHAHFHSNTNQTFFSEYDSMRSELKEIYSEYDRDLAKG